MIGKGFFVTVSLPSAMQKQIGTDMFTSMVYDINTIAQAVPSNLATAGPRTAQISMQSFFLVAAPQTQRKFYWVPAEFCKLAE